MWPHSLLFFFFVFLYDIIRYLVPVFLNLSMNCFFKIALFDSQQLSIVRYLGGKVWDVHCLLKRIRSQVVEGTLIDQEFFMSTLHYDFSLNNEEEVLGLLSSLVELTIHFNTPFVHVIIIWSI